MKHRMSQRQNNIVVLAIIVLMTASCVPEPASEPSLAPLPPDPQEIAFQTESGTILSGRYYPAAINPAPVIVLMYGGGSRMAYWAQTGIVEWLQNRQVPLSPEAPEISPPLPSDRSFAVFIFDYQGDWIESGIAAIEATRSLPGADPYRVATIGASVGSAIATYACAATDCSGALAFSPTASFNRKLYRDSVTLLEKADRPTWCIAAEGDGGCPKTEGSIHGMSLLLMPGVGQDTLDFFECAFGNDC